MVLPCGLLGSGPPNRLQERSTIPGRNVGLELQWKLLMVKADTAPFVLKHRPESAASGLYPQPTETCLPITWAMSCLPQRFTLTYTHTHPLTAPQPPSHAHPLRRSSAWSLIVEFPWGWWKEWVREENSCSMLAEGASSRPLGGFCSVSTLVCLHAGVY